MQTEGDMGEVSCIDKRQRETRGRYQVKVSDKGEV
jgi:hypothetical protein